MIDQIRLLARALRYRWKLDAGEISFMLERIRKGQTALDIGAHKGAYTHWMRRAVGAGGRVIAFEPQPTLANRLRKLFRGPGCRSVQVEWLGLSSRNGEMTLAIPADGPSPGQSPGQSPGASLEESHQTDAHDQVMVPVETLDAYCARNDIDAVHFIKCDVEGHELEVFRGGEETLRRDHPILLFECEARHRPQSSVNEVFSFLQSLGYAGFFFQGTKLTSLEEFDPQVHQREPGPEYVNNFVFLRSGR